MSRTAPKRVTWPSFRAAHPSTASSRQLAAYAAIVQPLKWRIPAKAASIRHTRTYPITLGTKKYGEMCAFVRPAAPFKLWFIAAKRGGGGQQVSRGTWLLVADWGLSLNGVFFFVSPGVLLFFVKKQIHKQSFRFFFAFFKKGKMAAQTCNKNVCLLLLIFNKGFDEGPFIFNAHKKRMNCANRPPPLHPSICFVSGWASCKEFSTPRLQPTFHPPFGFTPFTRSCLNVWPRANCTFKTRFKTPFSACRRRPPTLPCAMRLHKNALLHTKVHFCMHRCGRWVHCTLLCNKCTMRVTVNYF